VEWLTSRRCSRFTPQRKQEKRERIGGRWQIKEVAILCAFFGIEIREWQDSRDYIFEGPSEPTASGENNIAGITKC
jgi:hypothetical protein